MLLVGRLASHLTERLRDLIKHEKKNDVLAPVTVVTPTRYAGLALRQELGGTGFANVRFMPLAFLSEMLARGCPGTTGAQTTDRRAGKPGGATGSGGHP